MNQIVEPKFNFMKKLLLIISFLIVTLVFNEVYSQTSEGAMFVSGSVGVSLSSTKYKNDGNTSDGPKYFGFSFAPRAGYFIKDNIAVGAAIGVFSNRTKYIDGDIDKSITVDFMPFARYYHMMDDKFGLFGHGELTVGFGKNKYEGESNNDKNIFKAGITAAPGVVYFVKKNIAIEATLGSIGFNTTSYKNSDDSKTTTSDFRLNLSTGLNLGFVFFLN